MVEYINGVELGTELYVAATGSSVASKSRANYICDGTADQLEILAAIAALPTGGGKVSLSEGTFTLADTIAITSSGVTIEGQGQNTLVKITAAVTNNDIINAVGSDGSELEGIKICNLKIQGYGDDAGSTADEHGIRLNWCNFSIVENIWAEDVTFTAIKVVNAENCIINNIIVEKGALGSNGGWYGVTIDNTGKTDKSGWHTVSNVTSKVVEHAFIAHEVDDFVASNIVAEGVTNDYAINLTACQRATINGFSFENCDGGIFLEQNAGTTIQCNNIIISNGVMTGPAGDELGILVTDSQYTIVENVILELSGQTGGGAHGIKIDADSDYSVVKNCIVTDAANEGIYFENGCTNSTVEGCQVYTAGGIGIWYGTGDYGHIVSNHVEACVEDGIKIASKKFVCFGNSCIDNDSEDAATYQGIWLDYADDGMIFGNVCRGNDDYQISIPLSNCERNVVFGNELDGSGATGTLDDQGTDTVVFHNTGWISENQGAAATTADGGTIAHGLSSTPTVALVSGSDPGEIVTVTSLGATNITVAIKDNDGSGGTSQTIYWRAWV